MPSEIVARVTATPDGPFGLIAVREGETDAVLASGWTSSVPALLARLSPALRPVAEPVLVPAAAADAPGAVALDAVARYYAGEFEAVAAVAVRQHGTPLREASWRALRAIRPGHPLSYTQLAAAAGFPAAVRAAASACAVNTVALFVPCHRVLRGDGTLGGFAWGLPVKSALLAREAAATTSA